MLKIGNQPRLLRLPSQQFLSQSAGRRIIQPEEMPDPAKMVGCRLGRLCNHGHVEASADYLSDLSNWSTFVGDPMKGSCRGSLLKNEPVEASSIEPVHCGPAVKPVAHIRRDALFTRDADESRHEAVIAISMYPVRDVQHRHAHPTRLHRA